MCKNIQSIIQDIIKDQGYCDVHQYIQTLLYTPHHGYYQKDISIGKEGDFVTSPHISFLFGLCVTRFLLMQWHLSRKKTLVIIEIGSGYGKLLTHILKTVAILEPSLIERNRLILHSVEVNPFARGHQQGHFSAFNNLFIHKTLKEVYIDSEIKADSFVCSLSNELFDAMPIQHLQGGSLRRIIEKEGSFMFDPTQKGIVKEGTLSTQELMREILDFLAPLPSSLFLCIDYGDDIPEEERFGDTLQAVYKHQWIDLFDRRVGSFDITHHVCFDSLKTQMVLFGRTPHLSNQGTFLKEWGINDDLNEIQKHVNEARHTQETLAAYRLVSLQEMGGLFKVLWG